MKFAVDISFSLVLRRLWINNVCVCDPTVSTSHSWEMAEEGLSMSRLSRPIESGNAFNRHLNYSFFHIFNSLSWTRESSSSSHIFQGSFDPAQSTGCDSIAACPDLIYFSLSFKFVSFGDESRTFALKRKNSINILISAVCTQSNESKEFLMRKNSVGRMRRLFRSKRRDCCEL